MRVNPNLKSQKNQKNRKSRNDAPMPPEVLAKGIATQKELLMALLPYMEWVKYTDLLDRFWKIITHQKYDRTPRLLLKQLSNSGLVERRYEGAPKAKQGSFKPCGYLYVRRISRTCPRIAPGRKQRLEGTYGLAAAKNRATKAKNGERKPPKKTVTDLTMDDVRYIRDNPHEMGYRELAEMHNIHMGTVQKIKGGHVPQHLKGPPAR